MKSLWSDAEAARFVARLAGRPGCNEDVALRVYTSRLIGGDPSLVLHGGGNTSVKTRLPDDLGEPTDVLCVKGSGWDLATLEPAGLPALRLASLQALRRLPALDDAAMVNAHRTRMLDASGPNPSVETLLHAFLPHKYVDHSHADVPYVMPGFALAKRAAEVFEAHRSVEGLLLLQHGLFTFGASARESYERHVRAVDAAERFIAGRRPSRPAPTSRAPDVDWSALAPILRGRLGEGERRYILTLRRSDAIRSFVDDPALADLSQRGVVTPDHVIRTKNVPLLLDPARARSPELLADHVQERLAAFREDYRAYFGRQRDARRVSPQALDPDPRVVLVPGLGLVGAGATLSAARIAADLYEHTIQVIRDAEAVGCYQALPEGDIFDMEYWSLEQAKLGQRKPAPFEGQVVVVTGAASGIGAATARAFAAQGAQLFLIDRDGERLAALSREIGAAAETLDVTDAAALGAAVRSAVNTFGGIDGLVSNAGTAPQGRMEDLDDAVLRQSFELNLFAHQTAAAAVSRVLRVQGLGGFLLFNASKSAWNPGPDFGPYALPKSALITLMKQYALENGDAGIRTGAVNADRIRTGLLSEEEVAARARARGIEPDAYWRSNLLGREVTANDVAEAFVFLARAPSTTAAVLTVDGGNIAASPR